MSDNCGVIIINHANEETHDTDQTQYEVTNVTSGPGIYVTSDDSVAGNYVTNVSVSSMCLCCSGQQARRCSVNIGGGLSYASLIPSSYFLYKMF